jgi:hypothetical protein
LAGCARGGPAAPGPVEPEPVEPAVLPSDPTIRVAGLAYVGGFTRPGWQELKLPTLAVYADGRAVARASKVLALDVAAVAGLVGQLRAELADLPPILEPDPGTVTLMDAPDTRVEVRAADGSLRSVRAYALSEGGGYPESLRNAAQRLEDLADRVTSEGQPYSADRIRLVTVPGSVPSGRWPDGVPVPPPRDNPVSVLDLSGEQARTAVAALPTQASTFGWPELATPRDGTLAVAWRYLLPDE